MDLIFKKEELNLAVKLILKQHSCKVIRIDGPMGAGKTTLISALCKHLCVEETVSSPSFSLVNNYKGGNGPIYHFDFYRLSNEMEAVQSGLDEMIDSGNTCLIEWAERIMKLLPESYVRVNISITGVNSRKIEITKV